MSREIQLNYVAKGDFNFRQLRPELVPSGTVKSGKLLGDVRNAVRPVCRFYLSCCTHREVERKENIHIDLRHWRSSSLMDNPIYFSAPDKN